MVVYDLIKNLFPLLVSYSGGQANPVADGIIRVLDEYYPDDCGRALNIYKIMIYISVAVKTSQEYEESKRSRHHG